ncbi:MAG: response regulator [Candidatus Accumulibacter sp.]|nr:response regulator [Accumulibacter sp.]
MRPQFDCLVLDVQLPGMSGLDLQEQLNALTPGTPVVFITAYDDPRWRPDLASAAAGPGVWSGISARSTSRAARRAPRRWTRSTTTGYTRTLSTPSSTPTRG